MNRIFTRGLILALAFPLTLHSQPEVVVQTGHASQIFHLAYSADGKTLLSASSDNTCNLWDVTTGMCFRSIAGNGELVTAAAFDQEGARVAIGSYGNRTENVQVVDVRSGRVIHAFRHAPDESNPDKRMVDALDFSPDGNLLASKSENLITLWDLATGKEKRQIKVQKNALNTAKNYTNSVVKFLDGGQSVAGEESPAGMMVPNISVWDVETGQRTRSIEVTGSSVRTKAKEGLGKLMDKASTGNVSLNVPKPTSGAVELNPFHWYAFSPDGQRIAYLDGDMGRMKMSLWTSDGGTLGEIDLGSAMGKVVDRIMQKSASGDRSRISFPVAFSHDHAYVAVGIATQVKTYAVSSRQPVKSFSYAVSAKNIFDNNDTQEKLLSTKFESYSSLAFNPSGNWLSGGGGNMSGEGEGKKSVQVITTWNLQTGKEVMRNEGYSGKIQSVAFSADGKTLVTGGTNLHLWSLAHGSIDRLSLGSRKGCEAVATSPDGNHIVVTSSGKTDVMEIVSGQGIGSLRLPGDPFTQPFALSTAGDRIAAAGEVLPFPAGGNSLPFMKVRGTKQFQNTLFSPNGKQVLGGGETCVLADAYTGAPINVLEEKDVYYVPGFNGSGEAIAAVVRQSGMEVVNVATGSSIRKLDIPPGFPLMDVGKTIALEFDAQGRYLAVSRTRYAETIHVWNVATGQLAGKIDAHSRHITGIAFHPSKAVLATASADAEIMFWELPSCKMIAALVAVDSTDFIISTPDQYYLATKGALDKVAFRLGTRAYPFEQFDLRYNRPDIVLTRLGIADPALIHAMHKAYQKRLKKCGFTEAAISGALAMPHVEVMGDVPVATPNRQLSLQVHAWDESVNLDRFHVWVNDVPAFGMNGKDLRMANTRDWTDHVAVELGAGLNKVQVACQNASGTESIKETFVVKYEGPVSKPDLYLITIGVSHYKDSRYDLHYASKDASDLSALLGSHKELYANVHAKQLTDAQATTSAVTQLKDFLANAKVDDIVVLFVAGHGLLDNELNYYFATYDVDFDAPATKGLAYEMLEAVLDGIRPRRKVLMMDTCHSGEVDKDEVEQAGTVEHGDVAFRAAGAGLRKKTMGLENSFELMQLLFADLRRGTGATVVSSAGGAEFALEGDQWNNGVFTYCVLTGLRDGKADLDGNGQVLLSELERYVGAQVKELTDGQQMPTSRMENLSGDFRVW